MYIGLDIGGTFIRGVLTDKSGKILSFNEIGTPGTIKEIENGIYNMVEVLSTSATVSKIDIRAIGIGSAGSIDRKKGIIISSTNITCFKNYHIAQNIEKLTGVPVFLENDATIALIGAWWQGNGNRFRNWILITLGTGIGGGVIIDNKVYTGQHGSSMEIGHMTIDYNGRDCGCGGKGCLEQYASARALIELAESSLKKNRKSSLSERKTEGPLTPSVIYEEALKKDETALSVFDEYSHFLGYGIASLINIFNPEAIIIGGGISLAFKLINPKIKKVVKERALKGVWENVQFFPIKDPRTIPSLGAAKIAMDSLHGK